MKYMRCNLTLRVGLSTTSASKAYVQAAHAHSLERLCLLGTLSLSSSAWLPDGLQMTVTWRGTKKDIMTEDDRTERSGRVKRPISRTHTLLLSQL